MNRYSLIKEKMPREFLLLQGTGCKWRQCVFCDYYADVSENPFLINQKVLTKVTGQYGVLDIINSGSCIEFDSSTINLIAETAKKKNIHTLWFEAHWMYRNDLLKFAENFSNITVKFRTGIETFDAATRINWKKGIPENVSAADTAKYFQGVCLLFGVEGQTRELISRDIELALSNFEYFSLNAFIENSTSLKSDPLLVDWFLTSWFEKLKDNPKAEILISNTDLGVGM